MASILGVETLQHTNGTTAATIDSSGVISQPAIPCACVGLTTANPDDTTHPYDPASGTIIKWDTLFVNQGSCYDSSTGRFKATKAGIWEMNYSILTHNATTTDFELRIKKNGTETGQRVYDSLDNHYRHVSSAYLFDLAQNDYIEIAYFSGGIYLHSSNHFSSVTWKFLG